MAMIGQVVSPSWTNFFIMAGSFLVVAVLSVLWVVVRRRAPRRRRKHRRHHRYRDPGVTLAQTGGLPPVRSDEKPPESRPTSGPG